MTCTSCTKQGWKLKSLVKLICGTLQITWINIFNVHSQEYLSSNLIRPSIGSLTYAQILTTVSTYSNRLYICTLINTLHSCSKHHQPILCTGEAKVTRTGILSLSLFFLVKNLVIQMSWTWGTRHPTEIRCRSCHLPLRPSLLCCLEPSHMPIKSKHHIA